MVIVMRANGLVVHVRQAAEEAPATAAADVVAGADQVTRPRGVGGRAHLEIRVVGRAGHFEAKWNQTFSGVLILAVKPGPLCICQLRAEVDLLGGGAVLGDAELEPHEAAQGIGETSCMIRPVWSGPSTWGVGEERVGGA